MDYVGWGKLDSLKRCFLHAEHDGVVASMGIQACPVDTKQLYVVLRDQIHSDSICFTASGVSFTGEAVCLQRSVRLQRQRLFTL